MKIFLITEETTLSLWCLFEALYLQKCTNSKFQMFPSEGYYGFKGILSANNSTVLYEFFLVEAVLLHFKQFWQLLSCLQVKFVLWI